MEKFKTIEKQATEQIVEKKSKFIANAFYVEKIEDIDEILKQIRKKYHDARHNCYAYVIIDSIGNKVEKYSDDGEPGGTAGLPILQVIKGKELCNILIVVTRYFGGILLGTGGLVKAYTEATKKVLNAIEYVEKVKGKEVKITMSYCDVENIKHYCIKNKINIIKEEYSDKVEILIEISNEKLCNLQKDNDKITIKMTKFDVLNEKYIKTNITV